MLEPTLRKRREGWGSLKIKRQRRNMERNSAGIKASATRRGSRTRLADLKIGHYTSKGARLGRRPLQKQGLLVFGVDAEGAGFVEGGVKGFRLLD